MIAEVDGLMTWFSRILAGVLATAFSHRRNTLSSFNTNVEVHVLAPLEQSWNVWAAVVVSYSFPQNLDYGVVVGASVPLELLRGKASQNSQ